MTAAAGDMVTNACVRSHGGAPMCKGQHGQGARLAGHIVERTGARARQASGQSEENILSVSG